MRINFFFKTLCLRGILAILLYTLIGCRTVPMYSEKKSTLLAGKVLFTGEDDGNDVYRYGVSLAGTTTSGIGVVLRNIATNDVYDLFPDKNGSFYVYLQDGEYRIDQLSLVKKERNGAWTSFTTNPALKVLKVERGKVSNIGTIQWLHVDGRNFVTQTDNSSEIQTFFSEQFPKSNWNQKDWKYEQLSFDVKPSEPIYNEINPTLLVGKVLFTGSDYMSEHGVSFAGITTSGIEIVLRNTATSDVFRFPADKNGLFYINLQEGEYWIDEIHIRKEGYDGSWATSSTNPALKVLEVEKGKVNNVGTILWSPLAVDRRRQFVTQTDNSSAIKTMFSEQFPESEWGQIEWKYEQLSFDVKKPLEPLYDDENPTLLVGEAVFKGYDYISEYGISFDGITTSGIEIVMRNTANYEVLRFPADKNGLFYIHLHEGEYWIEEIHMKKEGYDGAGASIYVTSARPKAVKIESGKVNNIGTILWSFVDRTNNSVVQSDSSSSVKNKFSKQFPKSNWNTKEWIFNPWSFSESVWQMSRNDMEESGIISQPFSEREDIFEFPDEWPLFNSDSAEGFRLHIVQNTRYPWQAIEKRISGRVIVSFFIDTDGSLVDAKVIQSVHPLLDAEALRVVNSSPKWTPGKKNGKPVKVQLTFPITFFFNGSLIF